MGLRVEIAVDLRNEPEPLGVVVRRDELVIESRDQLVRLALRADQRSQLVRALSVESRPVGR